MSEFQTLQTLDAQIKEDQQNQGPFNFDQEIYDMVMADPRVQNILASLNSIDLQMLIALCNKAMQYLSAGLAIGGSIASLLGIMDIRASEIVIAAASFVLTTLVDMYAKHLYSKQVKDLSMTVMGLPDEIQKYTMISPDFQSKMAPHMMVGLLGRKSLHPLSYFSWKRMTRKGKLAQLAEFQKSSIHQAEQVQDNDENEPFQ